MKKKFELVKRRYLELLKSCLTNEIYVENDLRIVYLMECLQNKSKDKFDDLHDITNKLNGESKQMLEAKNGRLYERNIKKTGYSHSMIGLKRMGSLISCLDMIRKNMGEDEFIECGV